MANIRVKFRQKLGHVITVLKTTNDRVGEAERHIADMEERSSDFKETLNQSLQTQEILQMKLTDLQTILNMSWSSMESNLEYNASDLWFSKEKQPLSSLHRIQLCFSLQDP